MAHVSRAHVFTRKEEPTFGGVRLDPPSRGPVYFGVAAVATVAIAMIVVNWRDTKKIDLPFLDGGL